MHYFLSFVNYMEKKNGTGKVLNWNDGMAPFGQINACGGENAFSHQVKNKKVPGKENLNGAAPVSD